MPNESEIRKAVAKAFDYRGDVTLTLRDGSRIVGYVFDRREEDAFEKCHVRLMPSNNGEKLRIGYDAIETIELTGRDAAEGKSFENWVRQSRERKARGEGPLSLEPESLEENDRVPE